MMSLPVQKGRLGRGLASLIGEVPTTEPRLPAFFRLIDVTTRRVAEWKSARKHPTK